MAVSLEHLIREKLTAEYVDDDTGLAEGEYYSLEKLLGLWKDDNPDDWPYSLWDREYWTDFGEED